MGTPASWWQLSLTVPAAAVELVSDALLAVGASGIGEDYPELHEDGPAIAGGPDEWTPAPPTPADGRVTLTGYLADDVDAGAATARLRDRLVELDADHPGLAATAVHAERLATEDWGRSWREHYAPVDVGERLRVRPSWTDPAADERVEIAIDPGLAFGTGTHFTTAACLAAVERVVDAAPDPGALRVLDVGTGTGVLAIGAAKLGAGAVRAFDNDPDAVDVARGNLERNGVAGAIELWVGTLAGETGRHDVVLANLLAPLLCELAPALAARLDGRGVLIASGLLVQQEPEVRAAFAAAGLRVTARDDDGDWVMLEARPG